MTTTVSSTAIIRGNYATSEGNKGNFTAWNSKSEQIFISKKMIEDFGIKEDKDFKPFFALIKVGVYNPVDENGNALARIERLEATAIFATEDEALRAELSDDMLTIKKAVMRRKMLEEVTVSSGLTEASVKSILESSLF